MSLIEDVKIFGGKENIQVVIAGLGVNENTATTELEATKELNMEIPQLKDVRYIKSLDTHNPSTVTFKENKWKHKSMTI